MREYVPSSRPGGRVPHAWVERDGRRISILDTLIPGSFMLLTSDPSDAWTRAVAQIDDVPIEIVVIDRDVMDSAGRWKDVCETGSDGALLVRPDQHVGWRTSTLPEDPAASLRAALTQILGR